MANTKHANGSRPAHSDLEEALLLVRAHYGTATEYHITVREWHDRAKVLLERKGLL